MHTDIQEETPTETAEGSCVIVDGLPGVALTLTAEVAEKLSHRLAAASVVAFDQRSTG